MSADSTETNSTDPSQIEAKSPASAAAAPAGDTKAKKEAPASKSGGAKSGAIGLLALIVALAAAGGVGWLLQQQRQMASQQLTSDTLEQGLAVAEQRAAALQAELSQQLATNRGMQENQGQRLAALEEDSVALRRQLAVLGQADRSDWQLAEVEYLLRLAHQRVMMGGDLSSAASLLETADNLLHKLKLAGLMAIRQQVARDLAAVRAAASVDTEGVFMRLAALQEVAADLPFFGLPEMPEITPPEPAADAPWYERLGISAQAAFDQLVVVQSRDVPVQALLSESQQILVRLRLSLLLEEARNAVLLGEQAVFDRSLADASALVTRYYQMEDAATKSVLSTLEELKATEVNAALPDISQSQQAMRAYIDARFESRGQVAPLNKQESGQ